MSLKRNDENEAREPKKRRLRVAFDLSTTSVHEVPRYAEIYGMHPRLFHFDRKAQKVPSCFGMTLRDQIKSGSWSSVVDDICESDSDDSDCDSDGGCASNSVHVSGEGWQRSDIGVQIDCIGVASPLVLDDDDEVDCGTWA